MEPQVKRMNAVEGEVRVGLGVVGCDARQGHWAPVVAPGGEGEVRLGTCCRVLHLLHPLGREVVLRAVAAENDFACGTWFCGRG